MTTREDHRASPRHACAAAKLVAGALLLAAGLPAFAEPYLGRSVQVVIAEIADAGIPVVYNEELVPPDLRVLAEPTAREGRALLEEVLAAHDLVLREVGGALAVTAGPSSGASSGVADDREPQLEVSRPAVEDLLVTASRYSLAYDSPASYDYFDHEEVLSLPKAAEETLRVIHRLPGAASTGVAAPPHIRGGEQAEILYRLDGVQLYEPFHAKDFLNLVSILDSQFVDAMDVRLGGFEADAGDRMSGVVDVSTVGGYERTYAEAGLSLFHTRALVGLPFAGGRGEALASIRRSNLDEVADLANSTLGEASYFDARLGIGYDFGDTTRVSLDFLRSEDSIGVNNNAETQLVEADYRNTYLWATLQHDWSERFGMRLIASLTDVENRRFAYIDESGARFGDLRDERDFRFAALKLDFDYGVAEWFLRWGLEFRKLEANYLYRADTAFAADYPFPGDIPRSISRDSTLAPDGYQASGWLSIRRRLGDRLTAEVGGRWDDQDYDGLEDSAQWSPRLNLVYRVGKLSSLRFAWGRFFQSQQINELQVEDGIEQYFPAQRSDHLIVGLEHEFASGIVLRVEGYLKDFDRLRPRFENLFDPLVLIPELEPDRVRIAATNAEARGVELSLAGGGADVWSWWFNYAWSRVADEVEGRNVVRSWDQTHAVNGAIRWASDPWDVTIAATWHTGWPVTPARLDDGEVRVGPRNSDRFDDFASIDIKVSRRFNIGRSELEAFVDITNVLLFKNPCCVEYVVADGPAGTALRPEQSYWPRFVPNLGVVWRF